MVDKKMISAKMGSRTVERLEDYSEREGISRSQATERMCKQGLDVEESDMRLVPVETDGGTKLEENQNRIQTELQEQFEQISRQFEYRSLILFLSIFWLGIHVVASVPGIVTIATGTIIFGGLVYVQIRNWRN